MAVFSIPRSTAILAVLAGSSVVATSEPITSQQLEFFENRIRPVLVENCYECHAASAKKLKGKLLLDSHWGWQQGGESGLVIIPGQPEDSLLLSALRYDKLEMPPKAKLPEAVIQDFETWIGMGAPDPREKKTPTTSKEQPFDLAERQKWWSLQPIHDVMVPQVQRKDWPRTVYDRFVLAGLEERGWQPAPPAMRRSLLRRATYDLTGLPPTTVEVRDFIEAPLDGAYEKVVDRLLESPHFGEQWSRHWMDVVRYAETKAFEADYAMPNVFQYRDYLIRAFNEDIPYDQFVREAIAGDLIEPRINAITGINESVIGPGYLYLTTGQHGPLDVHSDEARIFDDMIDVIGKTFLGHTLACARCHDHKFDAITSKDYYSLYGVIASSRIDYADINSPTRQVEYRTRLREKKKEVRQALVQTFAEDMRSVRDDFIALQGGQATTPQQKRWSEALEKKPNDVMRALSTVLEAGNEAELNSSWEALRGVRVAKEATLGNLTRTDFGRWISSGVSFESAPRPAGDFILAASGDHAVAAFMGGRPAAGHLASRFAGSLKSPMFSLEGDRVQVRVKGRNVRVSLYVRHYELIGKGPTTNGTTKVVNSDTWQTITFNTKLWIGEPAYVEVQHNGGEMRFDWSTDKHVDGAYAVVESAVHNAPLPPPVQAGPAWRIEGPAPNSREALLDHLATRVGELAEAWRKGKLTMAQNDLLMGLHGAGVLEFNITRSEALQLAVEAYRNIQLEIPSPTYVRSLSDGWGADEPVYIRGSHRNPSPEPNPRHFLHGIDGTPFKGEGSGRRQWAEALVAPDNPLVARVMVNRIWHHLFGRGIVASVDDFGHMGEEPSHPELLDYLSQSFVENGWSVKQLIRSLVLSSTYRMSSQASRASLRDDPKNTRLQQMPIRRLQAEAIRDTLLAVSGDLDRRLFGPSREGDGANRRSVYIRLRRRSMPEFLMTFDMPNASEPFGRRHVTSGPAQSLALMNGPQTWKAAEQWAQRVLSAGDKSFEKRIDLMHRQAFGRGASEAELRWARGLLADHGIDETAAVKHHWKGFCHTMLNRKELIYVH
jgi:hypothetical protein